jgi:ketosteroid isomerase-like protein
MGSHRSLLEHYVESYNAGDLDDVMDLYAEDAVQLMPDGTELPPTGQRVEIKGMELVKIRDGKIVVDNLYFDNMAVAAQLGVFPQAAPATAS